MGVGRNGGQEWGGNLYLYSRLLLKQARSFYRIYNLCISIYQIPM